MKCYTIKNDGYAEGIDCHTIPISKELYSQVVDGRVMDAVVIPSTKERDSLAFESLFKESIHRASAICDIVFDVATQQQTNDRILVAYSPSEHMLSVSGGDSSDIVFRSRLWFVALCSKDKTIIRKIKRTCKEDNYQIIYSDNGLEKAEIPFTTKELPEDTDETNFIVEIT